MKRILTKPFFDRPTLVVARDMLGKYIVRRIPAAHARPSQELTLMITEVEAYDGPNDLASHARFGRAAKAAGGRTPRAAIMWGEAGWFYVYFTYGMHWLMNVTTGPVDYPAAVLIRAAGNVTGPARLTRFLKIDGTQNRTPAVGRSARASGLWFENRGVHIPRSRIIATPRIGVDYAGPIWAGKEWNFKIKPERFI